MLASRNKSISQNVKREKTYPSNSTDFSLFFTLCEIGPSCSKHCYLSKLVSGQNVNCSSKYSI